MVFNLYGLGLKSEEGMRRNVEIVFFIFVPVLLLLIWYLMPIVSVVPILLYLAFLKPPKVIEISLLFLVASVFGLINFTKAPESDLLNYYSTLHNFLNHNIFSFRLVEANDPAFYFITAIISHLTNASGPVFILFWTTVTYFVVFVAVIKLSKLVNLKRYFAFGIIGYVAFLGYSIGLSGHLVRQYAAMSFLLLSFVVALSRDKRSYFLFLISFLLHHSILIFFPVIYFANLKFVKLNKFYIYSLILISISVVIGIINLFSIISHVTLINLEFLNYISSKSIIYIDVSDGSLGIWSVIEMLLYSFIFLFVFLFRKDQLNLKMLFFLIFFWSLIIVTRSTDLLLLRYFMFGFGVTSLALVIIARSHHSFIKIFVLLLIFSAIPRFFMRIKNSNWTFISNDFEIIFYSVNHIVFN